MAKLANFMYCINAERVPAVDGKGESLNAIGVMSVLMPEFVPGTFSFSVIFSILDIDTSETNVIRIVFLKEGEDNVLADSGIIALPPMSDTNGIDLPDEYKGLNMSMDFRNVVFETEGVYNTKILFNNQLLEDNLIYVKGKR